MPKFKLLITGLPRTGTTNMWRLCKELAGEPIYYEPFNEGSFSNIHDHNDLHDAKLWNDYKYVDRTIYSPYFSQFKFQKDMDIKDIFYFESFMKAQEMDYGVKENRFCGVLNEAMERFKPEKLILCTRRPEAILASVNFYKMKGVLDHNPVNFYMFRLWNQINDIKLPYIQKAKRLDHTHQFIAIHKYFNTKSQEEAKKHPNIKIINHDDMCKQPGEVIKGLCKFLEVPFNEEVVKSIKPEVADKWKKCFSEEDFIKESRRIGL